MVEVECMYMVEVKGMNMEDIDMVEDMTVELDVDVVEKEHKSVVLVKHWINDGAERHQ
jgi:hypothetical protein